MTEDVDQQPAPVTGHRVVDEALAEFGSLRDHAPAEHHDRLAQVQEVLAAVLENRHDAAQTTIPGTDRATPRPTGDDRPRPRPR